MKKKKKSFILSFCQNSLNYREVLDVCLYFLKKKESEQMHKTDFQGLNYIIIRFKKIDFDIILPFIKKFIILEEICVYIYAESLLADIAIMIPELKGKLIPF